jgi:hypothetical protein
LINIKGRFPTSMPSIKEITEITRLSGYRAAWRELLRHTPGGSFFQSLEWLEIYWKHYGEEKRFKVLIAEENGRPTGILPLVAQRERTRLGSCMVLTYPLDNWGSFYGPIGPEPKKTLAAGLEHLKHSPRDWDFLELRGGGAPGTSAACIAEAFAEAGLKAYPSRWGETALVDLSQGWDAYLKTRKGLFLRRLRQAEAKLKRGAKVEYVRSRPAGTAAGDGDSCGDYFAQCQALAEKSWQAAATDGTTLCHQSVKAFLEELHAAAAAEGALDINLLLLDGRPAAFIYGYCYRGYVFGLRRGFDPELSRSGAGNVLLWHTLRDSAERGDAIYDMGAGSIESKRYFLTRVVPIYRHSYFPGKELRSQIVRLRRWWDGRRIEKSAPIAAGCFREG